MARTSKVSETPNTSTEETPSVRPNIDRSSVNRVTLVGRLVADIELRYTSTGIAYCKFRVATNDAETAEFHNVVAWRGTAEVAGKLGRNGARVYLEGRLHNNTWQTADGEKRYSVEVVAHTLRVMGAIATTLA
jgi:single-strand DNA-binding protein